MVSNCVLTILVVVVVQVVTAGAHFDCGLCVCNYEDDVLRAVCNGQGLTSVPTWSKALSDRVVVLGLARNNIQRVTMADLTRFPSLLLMDLRDQSYDCVDMPSIPPSMVVYGVCVYL